MSGDVFVKRKLFEKHDVMFQDAVKKNRSPPVIHGFSVTYREAINNQEKTVTSSGS